MKKIGKICVAVCLIATLMVENMPILKGFTTNEVLAEEISEDDFVISSSGELISYNGKGGDVVIPEGVISIGSYAFEGCRSLTSVMIPEGVTSIGDFAFYCCTNLTSLTIPEGVTSIGSRAFYCCDNLKSITIPKSLADIGIDSFKGTLWLRIKQMENEFVVVNDVLIDIGYCENEDIIIPEGVTSIGNGAFYGCRSLTNVTIPETVSCIGSSAFYGCDNLKSITIPEGVTSIKKYAFYGCRRLTSISFPESLTSIENRAFSGCSSLTNISFLQGLTNVDYHAFNSCSNIISVTIPCGLLKNHTIGGLFEDSLSTIEEIEVLCPDNKCTIRNGAFSGCSNLKSINIPEGVTNIGDLAFYGCSNLNSMTIPEGVVDIGRGAFEGTSWLTDKREANPIVIVNNILVDGKTCANEVVIPESVTKISEGAFDGCNNITSVTLPGVFLQDNTAEELFPDSFSTIEEIEMLSSEDGNSIKDSAFSGCSNLKNVILHEGITSIGARAFYGVQNLKNIIIPEGVTSIGGFAFGGCSELASISLPESVKKIGNGVFWECSNLKSITLPKEVESISYSAFSGCSSLENINIPESVTNIGDQAFNGCSSLEVVEIPQRITNIPSYCFMDCTSLQSVTIPKLVTSIEINAFQNCSNLKTIKGYKGTYAEIYAEAYVYEFVDLTREENSSPEPSVTPSEIPSEEPSVEPSEIPSEEPSVTPSETPSEEPSATLNEQTKTPYVTHDLPQLLKIGDTFGRNAIIQYHNLRPNEEVVLCPSEYSDLMISNWDCVFQYHGWGPMEIETDENGNASFEEYLKFSVFRPGTFLYTPSFYYAEDGEDGKCILTPIAIEIEKPVISDNVPETVKVGDGFVLKTELTNVNLKNRKVADYENEQYWDEEGFFVGSGENLWIDEAHTPAYRPVVTIVEGEELVERSNQDYSNTLFTSETLSFTGEGVVKLKITYNQIKTCSMCLDEKSMYSPEKIITITVQDKKQAEISNPTDTPKDEVMLGDINLDGDITLSDAQLALKVALGITELNELQTEVADVNGKDGISLTDAQLILRKALGIITSFDEEIVDTDKGQDETSLLEKLELFSSNTNMDLAKEFVEADIEQGVNRFIEKTSEKLQYQQMYEGINAYDGVVNREFVVEYWQEGNLDLIYKIAVDGITLFGVKPGDSVQKVVDIMAEYGFYQQDEYSDNYYINGTDIGSYYVTFEENNGNITNITIGTYSAFAG